MFFIISFGQIQRKQPLNELLYYRRPKSRFGQVYQTLIFSINNNIVIYTDFPV
ncbi:hypothetical protein THF1C08_470024 [Vibrio jasicida]|uniref:Uncharacterized protein n=1 Tax=Vibrio jasicida TaxID=766224 RepID=A0AAU9QVA6_9VIBR|nr:hypothetical protein THF1C08_470024 [Vibrio jasicida]CAH1601268.1 hypothetical protein THF1A12_480024 [Vibrio jasicida]